MFLLSFLFLLTTSSLFAGEQLGAICSDFNAWYVGILFSASALFLYLRHSWCKYVPNIFFWIHFAIVSWSALMYLNLVFDTALAPFVYYADWVVSTPLIMLALAFTAMYPLKTINWPDIFGIMFVQLIVVVSGLLAHIAPCNTSKMTFFVLGNIFMLVIFKMIFGSFMKIAASNKKLYPKYRTLALLFGVFWISYPLVWILGTQGYQVISPALTSVFFVVLPILCKPVFGFVDLYLLYTMKKAK